MPSIFYCNDMILLIIINLRSVPYLQSSIIYLWVWYFFDRGVVSGNGMSGWWSRLDDGYWFRGGRSKKPIRRIRDSIRLGEALLIEPETGPFHSSIKRLELKAGDSWPILPWPWRPGAYLSSDRQSGGGVVTCHDWLIERWETALEIGRRIWGGCSSGCWKIRKS